MKPNTRHVEPARTARGLGHEARHHGEHQQADRHVDEQRPAPGGVAGERAAEQQPEGPAGRGHRAEQCERPVAGGRGLGRGGDQREHVGRRDGRADALQRAGADQQAGGRGEPAEERAEGEDRDPGEEGTTTAEHVTDPAAEQQQPAEGERVGVEHPGEGGGAEPEVVADPRQRHVHHGHVEDQHQLDEHHQAEPDGRPAKAGEKSLGQRSSFE
jgi:hypothetical protein